MSASDHNSSNTDLEVRLAQPAADTLKRVQGAARWQLILGITYSVLAVSRDQFVLNLLFLLLDFWALIELAKVRQ